MCPASIATAPRTNWMSEMSRLKRRPSESTYERVVRCGITLQILGVLLFSTIIFVKIPIVLTFSMSAGIFLIALGMLAWLWSIVWGRA